jgi:hypothetical protein
MMFLIHRDIGLFEESRYNFEKGKREIYYYHAEVSDDDPPAVTTVHGVNGVHRFMYGEFASSLFYLFYKKGSWVEVSRGKLLELYKKRKEKERDGRLQQR